MQQRHICGEKRQAHALPGEEADNIPLPHKRVRDGDGKRQNVRQRHNRERREKEDVRKGFQSFRHGFAPSLQPLQVAGELPFTREHDADE